MSYTTEKRTVCGIIPVGPKQSITITLVQQLHQRVEFTTTDNGELFPLGLEELYELRKAVDKAIIAMHSARAHLGDTSDAEQQDADEIWHQFLEEAEC
jgi:hypothetical protein